MAPHDLPQSPCPARPVGAAMRLLKQWEGCRLTAYLDSAGVVTIGFGTTRYENRQRVQMGDTITQAQAEALLEVQAARFAEEVDNLTRDDLTERQLDALTSFAYNLGTVQFRGSTLRQRVNTNPNDPDIRVQFLRFHKAKGRPIYGLWRRRHAEGDVYFGTTTPCPTPPFPVNR